MKKKILSLICSIATVATMLSAFAVVSHAEETPKFKVVVDAEDVTNIKAGDTFNVSVVMDGLEGLTKYDSKKKNGTGVSSLQFVLFMPENEYIVSGSETVCSGAVANWIEADGGWNLSVAFSGAAGAMISSVPYTVATVEYTAEKDVTEEQVFEIVSSEVAMITKQVVTSGSITSTTDFALADGSLACEKLVLGGKEDPKVTVATLEDGGKMYGMNTKVAEVSVPEGATASKATVTLGEESKTYELPAGVKGQVGSFIAIIRYAADLVNPAFTLTVE